MTALDRAEVENFADAKGSVSVALKMLGDRYDV